MKNKLPHPETGKVIQGTFSECCNTSVSPCFGYWKGEVFVPFHHKCNACGKETTAVIKDAWTITEAGKYKPIPEAFNPPPKH